MLCLIFVGRRLDVWFKMLSLFLPLYSPMSTPFELKACFIYTAIACFCTHNLLPLAISFISDIPQVLPIQSMNGCCTTFRAKNCGILSLRSTCPGLENFALRRGFKTLFANCLCLKRGVCGILKCSEGSFSYYQWPDAGDMTLFGSSSTGLPHILDCLFN